MRRAITPSRPVAAILLSTALALGAGACSSDDSPESDVDDAASDVESAEADVSDAVSEGVSEVESEG